MTVEEEAEVKAKADEAEKAAKAAEDTKAKAEAAAKAKADADAKAEEQARSGGYTEEQWKDIERKFPGLSRSQIVATAVIAKSMVDVSPQSKLLEKDAYRDAKEGLPDFNFYEADVKKEIEKLPAADRQNSDRIKDIFFQVKGRKISEGKGMPSKETFGRRVSSGIEGGGGGPSDGDNSIDFGTGADGHDREEVVRQFARINPRFSIKDKKEFESLQRDAVPVPDERGWEPKFK